jgi:hypothetical protein
MSYGVDIDAVHHKRGERGSMNSQISEWLSVNTGTRTQIGAALGLTWVQVDHAIRRMKARGKTFPNLRDRRKGPKPERRKREAWPLPSAASVIESALKSRTAIERAWGPA